MEAIKLAISKPAICHISVFVDSFSQNGIFFCSHMSAEFQIFV